MRLRASVRGVVAACWLGLFGATLGITPALADPPKPPPGERTLTILNFNDFHGRIASANPNTVQFFGTIEEQRQAAGANNSLLLSAGDNIGGTLFASAVQADKPTIDILNAVQLDASAVGNHEFDRGYADLAGRVDALAKFPYLGANVYKAGTKTAVLPEYRVFDKSGLKVAVIGAVTKDLPSLVSPDGLRGLDVGDPVEAVNRVAAKLTDGNLRNGEADIVLAEYHEGAAVSGSLAAAMSVGGAFAHIVKDTSSKVAAIFTAHTHLAYVWDAPMPGQPGITRPVIQSASYASLVGKVTLSFNGSGRVKRYTATNLAMTATQVPDLVAKYPRVAATQTLVTQALAQAGVIGGQVIGTTTAPITRALNPNGTDNRAEESTLTNLVANMFRDQLADPLRGGAQIGLQNPGGTRADLDSGDITYAEAASVLPFANTLMTLTLTGAQFKQVLEEQWQPPGSARPFLALGVSDNVTFTYDANRAVGDRITSVTVDGQPLDAAKSYRIATASFLAAGGDNFTTMAQGTDKRDSGRIDLEAWVEYVRAKSPLSPSYAKHGVQVQPAPQTLTAGQVTSVNVSKVDFVSNAPANFELRLTLNGTNLGSAAFTSGSAQVNITVPADAQKGAGTLVIVAAGSGTTITIPVTVV